VTGADASAVLSMVAAGVCQGGVVSQADFDLYSLNALANPHCNLEVALTATSIRSPRPLPLCLPASLEGARHRY